MYRSMTGRKRGRGKGVVYQNRDYNTKRRKVTLGKRGKTRGLSTLRSYVARWQASSPSYLGPGYYRLAAWLENAGTTVLPIHFMSLTNLADHGIPNPGKGCFGDVGMCRVIMDGTGNFGWLPLGAQDPSGSSYTASWKAEQDESSLTDVSLSRRVFHDWSDIRINLYGTFSVPITYTIYVMQVKEQLDLFQYPQGPPAYFPHTVGSETANFLKDVSRALIGNSVNTNGRIDWYKDVKILKKERIVLQPLAYSDQAAELSGEQVAHTPNIHEYRMFIRHGRFRDYKWSEDIINNPSYPATNVNLNVNQWDVNNATTTMSDVEWGKRVFLFITATCPSDGPVSTDTLSNSARARTEGSYDVNIRNKFRFDN